MPSVTKLHGDCIEVMASLPADSVDAICTDPPYGLSFMGKAWDKFDPQAFQEFNRTWGLEALRVAKPGAHLLAFGGTRTYHRLASGLEDAGWEIRDCILWVYGSGFPKSLDVGKAIDAIDAAQERLARARRSQAWFRLRLTPQQCNALTDSDMGHHLTTHPTQPFVPTPEMLDQLRPELPPIPEWLEELVRERKVESENMAARPVLREEDGYTGPGFKILRNGQPTTVKYTAPHTEAAKLWDGWGTALKPAVEPVVLARKRLCGTVAQNVLAYGTGALNIDGCRVGSDDTRETRGGRAFGLINDDGWQPRNIVTGSSLGRWPANLIHDGSEEVVAGFPAEAGGGRATGYDWGESNSENPVNFLSNIKSGVHFGDVGSAGFFYCAKVSSAERQGSTHPTIKPLDLMRYLVRLVTPPGGTVLDPFAGSGTTAQAAIAEGFSAILIEREAEYHEHIERRLHGAQLGLGF